MNLTSQHPYWALKNGILHTYPSLNENIKAEIAIIGGGITGALIAWHLVKTGHDVVVFDKRDIGTGSTSASTALLQYEIDVPLHTLIKKVGISRAQNSYLGCFQAINDLEEMIRQENFEVDFERKSSLQYASSEKDVAELAQEVKERTRICINCHLLGPEELKDKFHIDAPAALYSEQGAQVDPYQLAHAIFSKGYPNLHVYDKTEIVTVLSDGKNMILQTTSGYLIKVQKLIIAAGYESQHYIPYKIVTLNSTYVTISEVCRKKELWHRNALIWETKTPYLYMRVTSDNRILIGGRDDHFYTPDRRDTALPHKAKQLKEDFNKLMPSIDFKPDFEWAGTFGETTDSLPYIGSIPQMPNTFFALGFGGNGITFSMLAAQIIRDALKGKRNEYQDTFAFER
ncbi:NAD(P)/FAD-dependent oxidoreductase [Parabacteroides pacaensis]|uniref:NAD(P)/FAD-dependent oxidoreductase n=1 Tax=Parabacteroides pacaensis TaxID=2086575 RepID=UPI000D0EECD1|nr:FAD-dependent oxidoreductase [Parabacteroides pacaensis]